MPTEMLRRGLEHVALSCLFRTLARLEPHAKPPPRLVYRPTFQVGPPRGGSTLIRQLIGNCIPLSHLSNLARLSWYHAGRPLPRSSARLAALLEQLKPQVTYQSEYGKVPALAGAAECEVLWDFWFKARRGPVEPGVLDAAQRQAIYEAVAAAEHCFGRPFYNKTSVLALRIRALVEIFPEALFIRTRRDPVDTAQSIVLARRHTFADGIGACPSECSDAKGDDPVAQACLQVVGIEGRIDEEQRAVGTARFLEVAYQAVCEHPHRELRRVATFLQDQGVPAPIRRLPPRSFPFAHGCKVEPHTYEAIRSTIAQLQGQSRTHD